MLGEGELIDGFQLRRCLSDAAVILFFSERQGENRDVAVKKREEVKV